MTTETFSATAAAQAGDRETPGARQSCHPFIEDILNEGVDALQSGADILLVDDELVIIELLTRILADMGHRVRACTSAQDALDCMAHQDFAMVITDVKMPGMSGLELLERIKLQKLSCDVIVITGYSSLKTAFTVMKLGAADFILKPFDIDQIRIVVEKVIRHRDLQEKLRRSMAYRDLALMDPLTEIYNRRFFDNILLSEIARFSRYTHGFCIMMCDIDDFKLYNDTNGHRAGDIALREVAWILKKGARASDFVTRYGGEEFAVILPDTNLAQARIAAGRLLTWIQQSVFPTERLLPGRHITVSAGIAACPDHGATPEALIDAADRALYHAKALGKNKVCAPEEVCACSATQ